MKTIFIVLVLLAGQVLTAQQAQDAKAPYPGMVPLDQYLIADRDAEIALARSAAPESISSDAEVLVLGRHGYETAVKGKNGFVCIVERSWTDESDDPEFWNPKVQAPLCLNPPAVRTYLPRTLKKTDLILAGRSKAQMFEAIKAAVNENEVPTIEPGAMCYMLSKQGNLGDGIGHWHPHLMFFVPLMDPAAWGTGLPGSPVVMAFTSAAERMTTFLIPVAKWSDGTAAHTDEH